MGRIRPGFNLWPRVRRWQTICKRTDNKSNSFIYCITAYFIWTAFCQGKLEGRWDEGGCWLRMWDVPAGHHKNAVKNLNANLLGHRRAKNVRVESRATHR